MEKPRKWIVRRVKVANGGPVIDGVRHERITIYAELPARLLRIDGGVCAEIAARLNAGEAR